MKIVTSIACAAAIASAALLGPAPAWADEATVVGPVTKIEMSADGKSAVATLKDVKTGNEVRVEIADELTLDKFKDKRIVEGDEIRTRFERRDGHNGSKSFKKTAGC